MVMRRSQVQALLGAIQLFFFCHFLLMAHPPYMKAQRRCLPEQLFLESNSKKSCNVLRLASKTKTVFISSITNTEAACVEYSEARGHGLQTLQPLGSPNRLRRSGMFTRDDFIVYFAQYFSVSC